MEPLSERLTNTRDSIENARIRLEEHTEGLYNDITESQIRTYVVFMVLSLLGIALGIVIVKADPAVRSDAATCLFIFCGLFFLLAFDAFIKVKRERAHHQLERQREHEKSAG